MTSYGDLIELQSLGQLVAPFVQSVPVYEMSGRDHYQNPLHPDAKISIFEKWRKLLVYMTFARDAQAISIVV